MAGIRYVVNIAMQGKYTNLCHAAGKLQLAENKKYKCEKNSFSVIRINIFRCRFLRSHLLS